jgi:hypothetical protein
LLVLLRDVVQEPELLETLHVTQQLHQEAADLALLYLWPC